MEFKDSLKQVVNDHFKKNTASNDCIQTIVMFLENIYDEKFDSETMTFTKS